MAKRGVNLADQQRLKEKIGEEWYGLLNPIQINDDHRTRIIYGWKNDQNKYNMRYGANLAMLKDIFSQQQNVDKEVVAKKVSALDYFYSTNLKEGYVSAVEKICDEDFDFDENVKSNDIDKRVEMIKKFVVVSNNSSDGEKDAVSFFTKYCANHIKWNNLDSSFNFPIFDKNVKTMLYYLNRKFKFTKDFSKTSIEKTEYKSYCEKVDAFNKTYFDSQLSYWDLDQYLWCWSKLIIYKVSEKIEKENVLQNDKEKRIRLDANGNEIKELLEYFLKNTCLS